MRSISVQGLRRLAARQGHSRMAFRRGRVARRRISMQEPKLTELGGNGVDLQIRSAQNPDFPPLDPNQVFMPNTKDHYVVVEDLDAGPWMTAGGLFVSVLQVEEDGTVVGEIPADFALEYDEYLKTMEEPIGQGEDWARVLDYFNLDVAEIDRWKEDIMESLKTGQAGEPVEDEEVAIIVISRQSQGSPILGPSMYVANVVGGSGLEYAITSEGMGQTASDALRELSDAWSRQGFLE